jgi:eukaryotic-like serine/threonine-protein kinase
MGKTGGWVMSDTASGGGTQPWDFESQINLICDRFEAAWKGGDRPRIEDYLGDSPASARVALLRELIPLDMEYRKRTGETVVEDEYHSRFPDLSAKDFSFEPGSAVPRRAGRYRLEGEIGRGGMGEVHRVLDPQFNRSLAVKILLERHKGRADLEQRFLEEAHILGQLQHPGIVPVHEIGRMDDGRPFFAMKLVRGQTLDKLLDMRPAPSHDLPRFLTIFEQICQTMANAHARGVIHRDLKPSNVMVGAFGEVQVMDWGLAKVLNQEDAPPGPPTANRDDQPAIATVRSEVPEFLTEAGRALGTFAFMPPEFALGLVEQHNKRSDVFLLGGILCAILTGQAPYHGAQAPESQQKGELQPAYERLAACGADAELILLAKACLTANREARPSDAGVVADRVAGYLATVQKRLRQWQLERSHRSAPEVHGTFQRRRRLRLVCCGHGLLAERRQGGSAKMVSPSRGLERKECGQGPRVAPVPHRSGQTNRRATGGSISERRREVSA